MQQIISKVVNSENLSREEARSAMNAIMDGQASDAQIAGFLVGLKQKGETVDEIAGFVEAMRGHMIRVKIDDKDAIDGVGTGGDGSHTFNITTAAALVTAAAGVTVAKHGNRSISSKCGSADLLEATGGNIDPGPERVAECINKVGFGFMFAPRFHSAMKHAAEPRRELGLRTAFNILGPMTNPAGVKRQVTGVYDRSLMPLVADVLKATGSEHVVVLHSRDGLDEFSVAAPTDYMELKNNRITSHVMEPTDVGLAYHDQDQLTGGDAEANHKTLNDVLAGIEGACLDAVLLNAGAFIYTGGKAESMAEGVEQAREAVASGSAADLLDRWVRMSNNR
ncbi:MAG: anthranilate phosphoribosyltransferase [Candidatus Zixiibacteriota bacterium]|nr:MAG: anthranilate phosphoribosyltransferase [candidate division Zixibacteria bacterium]